MRSACFLSVAMVVLPMAALAAPAIVADGTPIVLRLPQTLKSGGPKVGDKVPLVVRDTIFDASGRPLIRNGAVASATITASKGAKRLIRAGELDFVVDYVTAVDGTRLIVRGMQRKAGKKVGIAARVAISLVFRPLMLAKGKDVTYPAGMQFAVYADGAHRVAPGPDPRAPKPLLVRDFVTLCPSADTALYAFTLTNPNQTYGLLNAAVSADVYDANGKAIGSSASPDPTDPQQVVFALAPGETRTFVKRVKFGGGYSQTKLYIAQPWASWDPTVSAQREMRVLYAEWKDAHTVTGMVRNDNPAPLGKIQVVATVRTNGRITALGLLDWERLDAGVNKQCDVPLTGEAAQGAVFDLSACGQAIPASP
jgi:hypothetical protein